MEENKKANEEETLKVEEQSTLEEGKKEEDEKAELTLIEKANQAAERLEKANKESLEIAKRNERMLAEMRLQGRSFAGQAEKIESEDEKWRREAKERYKGTGLDPT